MVWTTNILLIVTLSGALFWVAKEGGTGLKYKKNVPTYICPYISLGHFRALMSVPNSPTTRTVVFVTLGVSAQNCLYQPALIAFPEMHPVLRMSAPKREFVTDCR